MEGTLGRDELAKSMSQRSMSRSGPRMSIGSVSSRSWASAGVREVFTAPSGDIFERSARENDDEKELKWAAIERLPTYDRLRKGILRQTLDDGNIDYHEVDLVHLGLQDRKQLLESVLKFVEEDNERFLRRFRDRTDRVGIEIPKVEVRFEHLCIDGDAYVGSRAMPTLWNASINFVEGFLQKIKIVPSKKRVVNILSDVNGIIRPSRMTLLLGPPGAGKTTLLKALAGVPDKDLRVNGRISYCGHELSEFIPQRTCAYISQHDIHHGEMTVRETLDFAGRCLGVGTRYELLTELARREKDAGIKPDPEMDAFFKATAFAGQESSLVTDYVLKILGMDICADILAGDDMRRGISGGQKKRLTTGEMLVGPAKVFFMDEISTGLDSSTTFQIVKYMRQMVHIMDVTMIISLLQPAPETYDLFDDIILLSEGKVVYQGPRENVLEFFESIGFKCPERKGVADFLQEVTSLKDQERYWFRTNEPYRYISVTEFAERFSNFHVGQQLSDDLRVPYDKSKAHPAALVTDKYGISNMELLKACLSREWLLMKRNSFLYIFKTFQITVMSIVTFTVFFRTEMKTGQIADGGKFYGALFFSLINIMFNGTAEMALTIFRLPVFFKQRDSLFYPAWAFSFPIWLLRIPLSFVESLIWVVLTYYTIGFAPAASRFFRQFLAYFALHQAALSLFRFIAALGRTQVVSSTFATFTILIVFVLGGFIVAKDDLEPWMQWAYYISPMTYGQNAIAINEFLDKRWSTPNNDTRFSEPTVGKVLLKARSMYTEGHVYWICVVALFAFSFLFNFCFVIALTYLNPLGDSRSVISDDDKSKKKKRTDRSSLYSASMTEGIAMDVRNTNSSSNEEAKRRGMVLPFQPLSLAFDHMNYYVDMPAEMKVQGVEDTRLQLLRNVSGAFRPGVLTALVGVSGAGKTTLMDVLAGRKTEGSIEGSISISGYPKNQSTFARISGYCEQNDIHSPHVTVYESLVYSAWLRLSPDVKEHTRKNFVEEVMELVELNPLRDSLVGLPGVDGLSTEQRKRLTIAVELVANPSIIFMDEPTSGLDARAAAIVMRTVRNTVDTGRTVVCTIHQPSIDIFEAFDELLLMKRGGQVIYAGPLGHHSHLLIEYFQAVPGVPRIKEGTNPATWMLDISATAVEAQLQVEFADIYANSELYRRNQELIKELSIPAPGSQDLHFPTEFSQPFFEQCKACFWKQHLSYWRHPQYNAIRFAMTTMIGVIFGIIFWNKGNQLSKQQDLLNIIGAIYAAVMFLGGTNTSAAQSVVSVERTVFYREKAAGMFSALPYAFAQVTVIKHILLNFEKINCSLRSNPYLCHMQVVIETIYIAIQTFIYSLIIYAMIGFHWTAGKFFLFYFFVFMCFVYFTMYGMMLVALTPNYNIAAIIMSFFLSFWNLFSGFLISRTQIPIWWRWYYWGSPVAWTIYGLVTCQVGDNNNTIEIPGGGDVSVKLYLKDSYGFEYDFLGVVAAVHVAWAVFFSFIFAYAIKFLNFQRR
ncbi:pleiotropic drug resistance protein 2-like isoform X1 [Lycium ferocissimum]|uniref:pleiotropic drug resistance protein 2-like isoform X1 n=1 Tax=Lycium ferocissimum TaxID=112874 RepID=UPI0028164C0C|nr:pleiotropic drug resistance protein 2-like isoform X1 [Lycium ferocissimum]